MPDRRAKTAEQMRLDEDARREKNWKRWGPYLAERQWGTVREDYSAEGNPWTYFTHDMARSRAYRWGDDGLLGICDRECRLCFAVALWNGRDPILKERLFGLTNPEGNHGEDVKECYYYLCSSPAHTYMKGLYKYPQAEFPYLRLVEENEKRTRHDPEFELIDTGIFDDNRYFDVIAEYAKNTPEDILIKLTVHNRGPEAAPLHLLPTLWFRNSWSWGCTHEGCEVKPWMRRTGPTSVEMQHATLGRWRMEVEQTKGGNPADLLFTDNETNLIRIFGTQRNAGFVKDGINDYIVNTREASVNPRHVGTKMSALYLLDIPPGKCATVRLRLFPESEAQSVGEDPLGPEFEQIFRQRIRECEEFYRTIIPANLTIEEKRVAHQAYAGLLWNKQFYHYVVKDWLEGDPDQPPPPEERKSGRNHDWEHLFSRDVLSMPDTWEYPWFAAWDLAFHMIPFANIDPEFAKQQLVLLLREWYMHPNGAIPAYEFNFHDANPPVHAWASWRVYQITARKQGQRDVLFLSRCFQKLLLNFTWWVNRKDASGKHIFGGGFLGLDNIGVFDRNQPLPDGLLEQADGTAWMAGYCAIMLQMALELAQHDASYEDVASKFFEHFVAIINAINTLGGTGLWDEEDGFYYDVIRSTSGSRPLRVRSMVGVIPLLACQVLDRRLIDRLPGFAKRLDWFIRNERDLASHVTTSNYSDGNGSTRQHMLVAIPDRDKLQRTLRYVLDESELLSPYGVRSLSKYHAEHPCVILANGRTLTANYSPGESETTLFGGNSNWRGPVWFPLNYLLVEALERYHLFYGEDFKVECPVGSGQMMNLRQVAREIERRMVRLFLPDEHGHRPLHGGDPRYASEPNWKKLVLFYEHFHGETGRGLGASHQTGWTALVTRCLEDLAEEQRYQPAREAIAADPGTAPAAVSR
jgi:hypothetical protein